MRLYTAQKPEPALFRDQLWLADAGSWQIRREDQKAEREQVRQGNQTACLNKRLDGTILIWLRVSGVYGVRQGAHRDADSDDDRNDDGEEHPLPVRPKSYA